MGSLYTYTYQHENRVDACTTKMANVAVFDCRGKKIGGEPVAKWQTPEGVVRMIVREHELRIANNKTIHYAK